jgi:hypothetical protein
MSRIWADYPGIFWRLTKFMQEIRYKIGYNDSINRWWVSDVGREPFAAPYETFDAKVNQGEAYVQIVYPVRREFLKKDRIGQVKYYPHDYTKIYFPFENSRVDFTTFIHTPHYIYVNAKAHLFVNEEGNYPFELYTCGGVKLWVNKEEIACFKPYTRNIPAVLTVELPLKKGYNEISVYADELAERDVFFYYELRYKDSRELSGVIFTDQDVPKILETEEFLKSCYLPRDLFTEGRMIIKVNSASLTGDLRTKVSGDSRFFRHAGSKPIEVIIRRGTDEIDLGSLDQFNIGVFRIFLACDIGRYTIQRELVVGNMPKNKVCFPPSADLTGRKQQGLDFIQEYGEKLVNRTLAILEQQHKMTDIAYECMDICIRKVEAKEDCADFYLPQLLLLITRYREYISEDIYTRIKRSILDFRYWIDEPGNDVMWYFSENHALLFHISQYLSGYLFPEDIFTASARPGLEQYRLGRERVENWFHAFDSYGYAEWNSATYIPVDLIGFFILYLMAPDEAVKASAIKGLDFTFRIITYNSLAGIMSSSYGRAYEETLKVGRLTEPNFLSWITYGEGFLTSESRAALLYCLSDYYPPACQTEVRLKDKEWMSLELDQGRNKVKTYAYRTKDYFIACVRRFKPFAHGHQQHLMNVLLGKRGANFYVNHPGERLFSGGNRPSYWAGNGTIPFIEQYHNLIVMIYRIDPEELVHYIHAYTPVYEYDEYRLTDRWLLIRSDDSYLGAYFSNGAYIVKQGANTGKEIISEGLNHGIIVKCGSKAEFKSFEDFCRSLVTMKVEYDGYQSICFEDPKFGIVSVKTEDTVTIAGKLLGFEDNPVMQIKKGLINSPRL